DALERWDTGRQDANVRYPGVDPRTVQVAWTRLDGCGSGISNRSDALSQLQPCWGLHCAVSVLMARFARPLARMVSLAVLECRRTFRTWSASIREACMKTMFLVTAAAFPLAAQWLHYPTPGIPRTKDGKPNMSAPAPKTPDGKPDLSGIWVATEGKYLPNLALD